MQLANEQSETLKDSEDDAEERDVEGRDEEDEESEEEVEAPKKFNKLRIAGDALADTEVTDPDQTNTTSTDTKDANKHTTEEGQGMLCSPTFHLVFLFIFFLLSLFFSFFFFHIFTHTLFSNHY